MTKQRKGPGLGLYFAAMLLLLAAYYVMFGSAGTPEASFAQVEALFAGEQVQSFVIRDGDELYLTLRDGSVLHNELGSAYLFWEELGDTIRDQRARGVLTDYDHRPVYTPPWWSSILLYALLLGGGFLVWQYMMARAQGGGGMDQGRRFGKTLLAKAVAGEAGVQFLSISGSDFVELYVGVGASRVRDLFEEAKKAAPSVVFIDEIDAVGRQRGAGLGGGHDEREQTLNQLLVEMDGFGSNEGVVVLAATNRADILDPALLRPGRFDRQVYVGRPDSRGREEILAVHAKGKPLAEDVDLRVLAQSTSGFTGADLENVINEGALLAARRESRFIAMDDLREAVIKVIAGPEKKSRVVPEHERRLTAYHEAGHAVMHHCLASVDPVHQVTIVPRGQSGGMTISLPEEDRGYYSKRYMEEEIAALLGGRVAESLFLDDISTGASNDIQRASALARKMVASYGMSEKLGAVSFDSGHDEVFIGRSMAQAKTYSEEAAARIDQEVKAIIDAGCLRCRQVLEAHRPQMEAAAAWLLEHETMSGEEFARVMGFPKVQEMPAAPPADR